MKERHNDLQALLNDNDFLKKIEKPCIVYINNNSFIKVLVVTHPGFIMEFINAIYVRKNLKIRFVKDSKFTSLYIIRVYCVNCGAKCTAKSDKCYLEYDTLLSNSTDHLGYE